jgi:hypothetical protein
MSTLPVLLTAFNRPETTSQVFQAIRAYRPRSLFVAFDGPRRDRAGEAERCTAVREIATKVDWECDVQRLVREENLGCRRAMAGAITWFFDHVEEGVILEDDCVPSIDLFRFCEELLDRYREDARVWMIAGTNLLGTWRPSTASYHFGHGGGWGWATWREAWQNADIELTGLNSPELVDEARRTLGPLRWSIMEPLLQAVAAGEFDSWAYAWVFSYASRGGLSALPAENLVTNLGFGGSATHTTDAGSTMSGLPIGRLDAPLRHPKAVVLDREFDRLCLELQGHSIHQATRARTRVVQALRRPIRSLLRRLRAATASRT